MIYNLMTLKTNEQVWEITRMIACNPDRSTVRTSDFKSENQGSIPCLGVFNNNHLIFIYLYILNNE